MKKTIVWIILLLASFKLQAQNDITIAGYLKNPEDQEAILYAKVWILEAKKGVHTNEYGYFAIQLPIKETYTIQFSSAEYALTSITVDGTKSVERDFFVKVDKELAEVVVLAKKSQGEELIENTEVSVLRVNLKEAKLLPAIGGETDILKVAQLLPGINRGGEGGTNFFVRGGDGDQNMILMDEATVYNPGHLFGFFSVFNADIIKEMTIYKGGFPANYSGRLSSFTDIRSIDGDKKKFHGNAGVGLLSSRIMLEGPLWKDKVSMMVAGRRSYIDQVFKLGGLNIPFYFYDLNAKIHVNISLKDKVFLSSYFGNDVLKLVSKDDATGTEGYSFGFGYVLGNFTQSLRWTHIFNSKLFSNASIISTQFKYDIKGDFIENKILIKSFVQDLGGKYDFQYYKSADTKFNFGANIINHRFRPNVVTTAGEISDYLEDREGVLMTTYESNFYFDVKHTLSNRVKIDGGLSLPQSLVVSKVYAGISPRCNIAYQINDRQAIKLSYSRMYQFMHRVSSSSIALPTDLWYPISKNIKPQIADQIAAAYNVNIPKMKSYIVLEAYYKYMQNLTEYKEGSQLILNDQFEDLLIQGKGRSYGSELLIKKDEGKVTGWIGYTLSFTQRQFDDLNGGKVFAAKYDRRHYLTTVVVYHIKPRLTFSAIFELASGARFTPIVGQYIQPNASFTGVDIIPIFAERNSYRMSPSHRLDINFVLKSKTGKKYASEWHFGAYNVYNRATPFQIKVTQNPDGSSKYTQPGLFGFIPSIGYNIKF